MHKRYGKKHSKWELISRSISRFSALDGKIAMGKPDTIKNEIQIVQELLRYIDNELILAAKYHHNSLIDRQINSIEDLKWRKSSQRGIFESIFGKKLDFSREDEKISELRSKMLDVRFFKFDTTIQDFNKKCDDSRKSLCSYLAVLDKSLKESINRELDRQSSHARKALEEEKRLRQKKVVEHRTKAMAAAHTGKTRQLAQAIRNSLIQQEFIVSYCPYCGGDLGDTPHADHIYPVARGGLSTEDNMVLVCQLCNSNKRDKTLFEFINSSNEYDQDFVFSNLRRLRKKF